MKILLLGKNGQIGWELLRSLAPLGEVVALDRGGGDGLVGDLTDAAGLRATVAAVAPDVIVNAAAYTAVDRAESEPELVHRINADGPGALAAEAAARGIWLVHYSTDYVFDGSGSRPWREDDPTGPLSVYGKSKLAGEEAIRASGCRHLILRTSWVYTARSADNFAYTILNLAKEREKLTVIADQIGAPTRAGLIADVTAHLVRDVMRGVGGSSGLYHLVAAGETSWHNYARFIVNEARRRGMALKAGEIAPIPSSAWRSSVAARPLNSRLDTTRLQRDFGIHLPDWQCGVRRLLDEIPLLATIGEAIHHERT